MGKPEKKTVKKSVQTKQFYTAYLPLDRKKSSLILLVSIGLSLLLYFQSLEYGYVLDDKIVFTENKFVQEGFSGIGKILSNESFSGYFGEQKNLVQGARFRPLSLVTFAIEQQLWGTEPFLSHLLNILFYGLCGWIGFLTLRRLFREKTTSKKILLGTASIASLLFLFHPIHVEAVANVKGRDEIMALLFSLLALLMSLKYVDEKKLKYLLLLPVVYILGLLSKENTITFAAIIPVGVGLFRKNSRKEILVLLGVLILTTLAYLMYRYQVIGYLFGDEPSKDLMNNSFVGMNTVERYSTIFYTLLLYLKLHIFPHPLTHDYYPYHIPIMNLGDWQVWLSIVLHVLLIILGLSWRKKKKKVAFGIFYYIAAMSIVSNLVISIGTFMNERFAFAASLGICIVMAYTMDQMAKRFPDKRTVILYALLGVFLTGFTIKTMTRVPAWENAVTLNRAAIKVSKNSARANSFMATALFNKYKEETNNDVKMNLLREAEPYARKATEIHPNYYNGHLMRVGIAAELYKYDRNLDNLLSSFKEAIKYRPDVGFIKTYLEYVNKTEDKNKLLSFYEDVSVNVLIDQQQKYGWAITYLNLGMSVDPNDPRIRSGMRKAYTGLGQIENANKFR